MFFSLFDEDSGTLIGKYQGSVQTDADYQRCIDAVRMADAGAASRRLPYVCVLVVSAEVPQPPPVWRRRMADTNNALAATEHRLALVTPSLVVRSVLTAISWLTRPRPGHQLKPFENFSSAAQWIRTSIGQPYPKLEQLYSSLEREMGKRAANG
jgi:hypothetical protein